MPTKLVGDVLVIPPDVLVIPLMARACWFGKALFVICLRAILWFPIKALLSLSDCVCPFCVDQAIAVTRDVRTLIYPIFASCQKISNASLWIGLHARPIWNLPLGRAPLVGLLNLLLLRPPKLPKCMFFTNVTNVNLSIYLIVSSAYTVLPMAC